MPQPYVCVWQPLLFASYPSRSKEIFEAILKNASNDLETRLNGLVLHCPVYS